MPFALIPFILLVIPALEIAVFILVGREIGVMATLGCILLTAIIGSVLLRVQGLSIIARIQNEIDRGQVPGRELGDGLMIVIAAVLLLTPGFVTDTIGFLLFVPAIRSAIWRLVAARISVQVVGGGSPFGGYRRRPGGDGVIDLDEDEFHETGGPTPPDDNSRKRLH
jgi:UPF0716 protein FxsA